VSHIIIINHQFELKAKMAEETDLEKCNFWNFRSSVTLTLTLDRVEAILVHISCRGLPIHQIRSKLEKTFCGRTDRPQFQSIRSYDRKWRLNIREIPNGYTF